MINIDISDRTYGELLGSLVGFVVLLTGNAQRIKHETLKRTGIRVEGTVVEIKEKPRRNLNFNKPPTYYPVISFETIDSIPIVKDHDIFSSYPSAYAPWDKVTVLYDPTNPDTFTVEDLSNRLIGPLIMLIGIAVIAIAII